jgi:hypothetical protein
MIAADLRYRVTATGIAKFHLVPKLQLGNALVTEALASWNSEAVGCSELGEAKLRRSSHSQAELGNENRGRLLSFFCRNRDRKVLDLFLHVVDEVRGAGAVHHAMVERQR